MYFSASAVIIKGHYVVVVPIAISRLLPSRGLVMARITLLAKPHTLPLEPDGRGSHWFEIPTSSIGQLQLASDKNYAFTLDVCTDWPEPTIPADVWASLTASDVLALWRACTTKARWQWLRWIRATKTTATRSKRIDDMMSKLKDGHKRPCCFNANQCTVTELTRAGKLDI